MTTITGTEISRAADLLAAGEVVAIPTETVYGLAANALDGRAVARIYEVKGRPAFNPLIVHVPDANALKKYAREIPDLVFTLAEKFSPGPITYVFPKRDNIPDIVTAGGDSVAIRIPAHPMARALLERLPFPLAAPSANPSGYVSPVSAAHVAAQLSGNIAYILDGGHCAVGLESTVVKIEQGSIRILRPGAVTHEMLAAIAPVTEANTDKVLPGAGQSSPGQLASHYAPRIPVIIGDVKLLAQTYKDRKVGLISLDELSPSRDLAEAAQKLFSRMRDYDATVDVILAEWMPNEGVGIAINDRLRRAAATQP